MAKKKVAAIKLTLTVPSELREKMKKVTGVNWSAIAADAFESELGAIAQRKKGLDMNSVRERLLASKAKLESDSYRRGFDEGVEWAKARADYDQLVRLVALIDYYAGGSPDFDDHFDGNSVIFRPAYDDVAEWLAAEILGPENESHHYNECLWNYVFDGENEAQVEWAKSDNDRLRGFAYGAAKVFRDADV